MHEIENIAFGNVSLRLKNLPHLTSVLENSYSSRDALLEDIYGGKQKILIGNEDPRKDTALSHVRMEKSGISPAPTGRCA